MKTIKLNEEEYVLKKDVDKLIKEKNEKTTTKKTHDIGVMDSANVSLIFNIQPTWAKDDIICLPRPNIKFKKFGKLDDCQLTYSQEVLIVKDNRYSVSFFKMSEKIIKELTFNKSKKPIDFEVYLAVDSDGKFKINFPCLFRNGDYGFILAPKVKND